MGRGGPQCAVVGRGGPWWAVVALRCCCGTDQTVAVLFVCSVCFHVFDLNSQN